MSWTGNCKEVCKGSNSKHFRFCRPLLQATLPFLHIVAETQETRVQSLGQEDPLEKEMATHPSILAWEISWTEVPGRLQKATWVTKESQNDID